MDYVAWIRSAATLGAEGLEHYDGFFRSVRAADVDPALSAMAETGQVSSMLCFSPDFTHPDAAERARQVGRQQAAIDLAVRLGTKFCRTLSGQQRPGLTRREGIARTVDGICRSLEYAERRDVVLCLENHYKDGTWQYPEFAQPEDVFLEILEHAPWLQDRLMFSTDYPHWDFDAPNEALPKVKLPDGFAAKLMAENARQLYKLPIGVRHASRVGLSD